VKIGAGTSIGVTSIGVTSIGVTLMGVVSIGAGAGGEVSEQKTVSESA
jgi:hypothetical protein